MPQRNFMDVREFLAAGALHEINRLVLHPLGLALQVEITDSDTFIGRIWDVRSDPEGIYFDESALSAEKAERVCAELMARREARKEALGYIVQPVPSSERTLTVNYLDPDRPVIPQGDYEFEQ